MKLHGVRELQVWSMFNVPSRFHNIRTPNHDYGNNCWAECPGWQLYIRGQHGRHGYRIQLLIPASPWSLGISFARILRSCGTQKCFFLQESVCPWGLGFYHVCFLGTHRNCSALEKRMSKKISMVFWGTQCSLHRSKAAAFRTVSNPNARALHVEEEGFCVLCTLKEKMKRPYM